MTNTEAITPLEFVTEAAHELDTAHDAGEFVDITDLIDLVGAAHAVARGLGHTEQEVQAAIERAIA